MNVFTTYLRLTFALALLSCDAVHALAQAPEPDAGHYAARVKLLLESHEQLVREHRRIVERKRTLHAEYVNAQAAVERLEIEAVVARLAARQKAGRAENAREEVEEWLQEGGFDNSPGYIRSYVEFANGLEVWARDLELQSRRLDARSRAVIDHMRDCIRQVSALSKDDAELSPRYDKLQADFASLLDLPGQRSREELEAALNLLGTVANDNPAGLLVRGVILRRLARFADAQADFSRVLQFESRWQPLALAARGESLVAEGKSREGIGELNRAVRAAKSDPRVLYLYAVALAAEGKYKDSERTWKRLLSAGGYDAFAHRNLTFLYSASGDNWRQREKAQEHAEQACDLTETSEWSCLLAFSTAKAANEEYDLAIEWAEHAAERAQGDKRQLCLEYIERYEAREQPIWDWKK